MTGESPEGSDSGRWDPLVERLRDLRLRAGNPSFAEVAQRITERRREQGTDEHAAKIARSTVYDAFRLGRTRLNAPLVREIVAVLGSDPTLVDDWLAETASTRIAPPEEQPPDETAEPKAPAPSPPASPALVLGLMAAFLGLNIVGRFAVDLMALPFYLDMVGTAAAAVILGPWPGVAVGVLTSVFGMTSSGTDSLLFMHAEIAGALLWGYGARRLRSNPSIQRFFALNVIVGLVVSLLAIPVIYLFIPEGTKSGASQTILNMQDIFGSRIAGTIIGNVVTNQLDKLASGFAALTLLAAMPLAIREASPLRRLLPAHT